MNIICFGDSLTRGVSFIKGRLRIIKENYPALLQDLFLTDFENEVTVINKGVFNDNSDLLIKRLDKDVINMKPDYAIVGIGGNDCNFSWSEVALHPDHHHEPIVPIQRFLDNVKTIVTKLKSEGITPVITTMPPLDPIRYYKSIAGTYGSAISHWISSVGGIEHWHGMYNFHLNKLMNELDVMNIDVRTALKQAGDLLDLISDDGIHLTSAGYKVLSQAIYYYLNPILKEVKPQHI